MSTLIPILPCFNSMLKKVYRRENAGSIWEDGNSTLLSNGISQWCQLWHHKTSVFSRFLSNLAEDTHFQSILAGNLPRARATKK